MAIFQSEESVFNMALEYLKDISTSLKMCKLYSSKEDIDNWLKWLRIVYRELSVKLKNEEIKDFIGNYNDKINIQKLTDNFIEPEEATFKNIYFLYNNPSLKFQYKKIIFFLMDALEIKIRRKLQERGMLLPSKDDPRFAVLKR